MHKQFNSHFNQLFKQADHCLHNALLLKVQAIKQNERHSLQTMQRFRKKNRHLYRKHGINTEDGNCAAEARPSICQKFQTQNLRYFKHCMLLRSIKESHCVVGAHDEPELQADALSSDQSVASMGANILEEEPVEQREAVEASQVEGVQMEKRQSQGQAVPLQKALRRLDGVDGRPQSRKLNQSSKSSKLKTLEDKFRETLAKKTEENIEKLKQIQKQQEEKLKLQEISETSEELSSS